MSEGVCLFFGTFNPIHLGHLVLAETALSQFGFHKVLFIPAGNPPHRQSDLEMASALDRLKMVRLAIGPNSRFEVSELEVYKPGLSYTIETLEQLFPDALSQGQRIPMILGADALQNLGTWHRAEALAQLGSFLQAPRPSFECVEQITLPNHSILPIETTCLRNPQIEISASQIRQCVRSGHSIRYMVSDPVRQYIEANGLYQEALERAAL